MKVIEQVKRTRDDEVAPRYDGRQHQTRAKGKRRFTGGYGKGGCRDLECIQNGRQGMLVEKKGRIRTEDHDACNRFIAFFWHLQRVFGKPCGVVGHEAATYSLNGFAQHMTCAGRHPMHSSSPSFAWHWVRHWHSRQV